MSKESDFPNINMSIGEYYKLLMEGKRPTRQRTHKEEPPKPQQQQEVQTQLKRAISSSNDKKIAKEQKISQNKDEIKKRKDKIEKKRQLKQEKEEQKQKEILRQELQEEIKIVKEERSSKTLAKKVLSSDHAKVKNLAPKEIKPAKREQENLNLQEQVREEQKTLDKFESVFPHLNYINGRFAVIVSKDYLFGEIIEYDEYSYLIKTNSQNSLSIREELVQVIGKPFFCKLSQIKEIPHQLSEILQENQQKDNALVIVAQIVEHKMNQEEQNENQSIKFITFIPSNDFFSSKIIPIEFLDSFQSQKDLIEFDQQQFVSSSEVYGIEKFNQLLQLGQKLQESFTKYQESVTQIPLTQQNMEDLLFTICSYQIINDNPEGQKMIQKFKKGILLRIKYDKYYQDYILLIRYIQTKANQKERVEWIQLSKYRIYSDLFKGYVSLSYIQNLENQAVYSHKIKLRHIEMVSYFDIIKQKSSLRKYYQEDGDQVRKAIISKENNKDRCVYCNYITQEIEHLKCSNCQRVYHEQCLHHQQFQSYLGIRETYWRCPDCIRCTNCLSIKNKGQMLICRCCNSAYHYDCLDQSIKLSIPSSGFSEKDQNSASKQQNQKSVLDLEFKCEHCVVCENCGMKEAGKNRLNKWSKDFKLCSNCNKKRKNKQYCPICEKFWQDQNEMQDATQKISCISCGMQVHTQCDRMFEVEGVRQKFIDLKLQYNCASCRQQSRIQLIYQLVERLANEDKMFYFQEPVEDHFPNYTKIIKTPMCFKYIRQKIGSTYLRNPEQLRSDCSLIFNNALLYNLPKTKVYKEAIRLNDICSQIIQSIWSTLERNKIRTLDEDLHQQKVREKVKQQKVGVSSQQSMQLDDNEYLMNVEDLFEMSEHMPIQGKLFVGERDQEISDYQEDDSQDYMEKGLGVKAGPSSSMSGGVSKNLRNRKPINYNEDKLLQGSSDQMNLIGNKRPLKSEFSGLEEETQSVQRGILKRQKNHDLDFQAPLSQQKSFSIQQSGLDLLSQAINNQQKLQEHDNEHNQVNIVQQQQQMMMNYYQEIDDEKCYYSNPIRCSFDDPALLFEEMCYLCGAFGNREDFLCCTLCGESFHTYCLSLPSDDISKFQSYWKCLNCKFCEFCGQAVSEDRLLSCDVCDKAFHTFCLKPQLSNIPNCGWKCQECFSCVKCGTKKFFSDQDTEQQKHLEVSDFQFSKNFSYCYDCGQNDYKKSFCNICKQKNEEIDQEESKKSRNSMSVMEKSNKSPSQMMKCISCGFYSHLKCSRVLPGTLEQIQEEQNGQNIYKCLECILNGKTINHLIRETCEHYENIHQLISRQKLLAQLCQEILQKYFPIQDKAPLFIKSFIDQNQDFFKSDEIIQQWLELLESNVCFESEQSQESTQEDKKDDEMEVDETRITQDQQKDKEERQRIIGEKLAQNGIQNLEKDIKLTHDCTLNPIQIQYTSNLNTVPIWSTLQSILPFKTNLSEQMLVQQQLGTDANKKQLYGGDRMNQILSQSRSMIRDMRMKNIEQKQWNDMNFDDVFSKAQMKEKEQKLSQELFAHKEGFLPQKRDLYKSLYYGNIHRYGQKEKFIQPEQLQQMITVPTEENLKKVNFAELYVKVEFKAVMKVKLLFFKWFEDLIKKIIKSNQKYLKKEQKKQQSKEDSIKNSDDVQMINIENQLDQIEQPLQYTENEMNNEEDTLINNPQIKLQCILCKQKGEYKITGRLIPYQVNQFVHVNCAFWSTDVYETEDGQLVNFFFVQNGKAKYTKCQVCNETGASIFCFTKKCNAAYHFPCAYKQQKVAFLRSKETFCEICCKQRGMRVGYLKEFNTHRRMYIVRNHQPWNTTMNYSNQIQAQQNMVMNNIDSDKPFQIEKWRPYYYDMFNRVGNLTVLSLKKEINQIIEDSSSINQQQRQDQVTDYASIRIYWKFYLDNQMMYEDENSSNPQQIKKGYFLYFNNHIREVNRTDVNYIMQFVFDKIKQKMHPHQSQYSSEIVSHNQAKFSIQEFAGKTKYPISIWNRAEIKNKQFFLKSGYQILQAQNSDDRDSNGNLIQVKKSEGLTQDDIFKNMLRINRCNDNQNAMTSIKMHKPSKHMNYEELLAVLGKKSFFAKHIHNERDQKAQQLNKKVRVTDTIDTNKEIDLPIAMKYRLSKTQPKRVEVGPSKIHRNGLFTFEDLMPGDIVIEYMGEKIRNEVADKREEIYNQKGIGDCYLFRLDREYIVDATFFGNKARYLNHSCDANCSAKIITVQGQKHIIISANRQIKSGEELTYNYNFDIEADKLECYCGAPSCLGRLN